MTKEAVKLRLDADVLAVLRSSGEGWQTRINDTLLASCTWPVKYNKKGRFPSLREKLSKV